MTATDKLNSAARSMGWANWAEVISHNAPPHVINAVVMRAMGEENTNELNTDAICEAIKQLIINRRINIYPYIYTCRGWVDVRVAIDDKCISDVGCAI